VNEARFPFYQGGTRWVWNVLKRGVEGGKADLLVNSGSYHKATAVDKYAGKGESRHHDHQSRNEVHTATRYVLPAFSRKAHRTSNRRQAASIEARFSVHSPAPPRNNHSTKGELWQALPTRSSNCQYKGCVIDLSGNYWTSDRRHPEPVEGASESALQYKRPDGFYIYKNARKEANSGIFQASILRQTQNPSGLRPKRRQSDAQTAEKASRADGPGQPSQLSAWARQDFSMVVWILNR
jgi:hypothetical protein